MDKSSSSLKERDYVDYHQYGLIVMVLVDYSILYFHIFHIHDLLYLLLIIDYVIYMFDSMDVFLLKFHVN